MGTRGAYGFRIDGQDKLTYNHFASYPDGLGEVIVQFCNTLNEEMLKTLKKKVKALKLVSEDGKATKAQVKKYEKFADTGVSTGNVQEWYVLMRNLQFGEILPHILVGEVQHMIDSNEFILDSLFCEYAYILDLDNDVLEMYKGFQETPDPNNRYGQKGRSSYSGTCYYPCKKICEFPILQIPPDWEDLYKKAVEGDNEEEDEREKIVNEEQALFGEITSKYGVPTEKLNRLLELAKEIENE